MGTYGSIHESVPLKHGASTRIRVVEILQRDEADLDSLIRCWLHVIALEDASAYLALS